MTPKGLFCGWEGLGELMKDTPGLFLLCLDEGLSSRPVRKLKKLKRTQNLSKNDASHRPKRLEGKVLEKEHRTNHSQKACSKRSDSQGPRAVPYSDSVLLLGFRCPFHSWVTLGSRFPFIPSLLLGLVLQQTPTSPKPTPAAAGLRSL